MAPLQLPLCITCATLVNVTPAASVHDLPIEVLQQIFAYACTDGGYTAYSISLVSRYCQEVVHPLRLHNVALFSIRQIESFVHYLERDDIPYPQLQSQSGVRHLFLSTRRDGEALARQEAAQDPPHHIRHLTPSRSASTHTTTEWLRTRDSLNSRLSAALPRLLRIVAPDLRTLSVVHAWELRALLLPCPFPRLRAFTSMLPYELQVALGYGAVSEKRTVGPRVFPDLQQVRVQLRAPPDRPGGAAAENYDAFVEALRKTQMKSECGAKLEVIRCPRYDDGYWDERIRREWLDGVGGVEGCGTNGEGGDSDNDSESMNKGEDT
ncbi:hypothetical protein BN946_scf184759.g3 [Trametes cinnabarina]|uniref:F-box domain-containing protein n=1 Tax=Pycnoporus cinnabarinus TaxID=5643 RepID=A0A060SAZ5_PYCCI|nr:hypothetical protein BN946_scf184759.g3 [Trametes cinnabarina]